MFKRFVYPISTRLRLKAMRDIATAHARWPRGAAAAYPACQKRGRAQHSNVCPGTALESMRSRRLRTLGPSAESTPPPLFSCPVDALGHDWVQVLPPKTVSLSSRTGWAGLPPAGWFLDRTDGLYPDNLAGFVFRGFCVPLASATPGSGNTLTPRQGVVRL